MKNKFARLSPLLFTFFGFITLTFVAINQFLQPRSREALYIQLITIVLYVTYMIFESKISFKEIANTEGTEYDRHTMEMAAVIKISLLFACLGMGNSLIKSEYFTITGIAGLIIMTLGFFVRGKSIIDLGESYGHRIRPINNKVHEKGIYSFIRHGAYTGTFLIHLGVTIIFLNLISSILIFAWLGIVIIRIQLEERLLLNDIRYVEYSKKTKFKMIPYIW